MKKKPQKKLTLNRETLQRVARGGVALSENCPASDTCNSCPICSNSTGGVCPAPVLVPSQWAKC